MTRNKKVTQRRGPVRYRPAFEISDHDVVERSLRMEQGIRKSSVYSIAFELARGRRPPIPLTSCLIYLLAAHHMEADQRWLLARSIEQLVGEMLAEFDTLTFDTKESLTHRAVELQCASLFAFGRPIYRFDPELLSVLATTDLSPEFPAQSLRQWRDWCAWIDFDGGHLLPSGHRCLGVWAFVQPDVPDRGRDSFFFEALCSSAKDGLYLDSFGVPIDGDVSLFINAEAKGRGPGGDIRSAYQVALQAALYLISEGADLEPRTAHARHRREGIGQVPDRPAGTPEWWEVGYRVGRRLREARVLQEQPGRPDRQPVPHIRRAHWHLYWTGKGSRSDPALAVPRHRWLHPALVGADRMEGHELPPTVHTVV